MSSKTSVSALLACAAFACGARPSPSPPSPPSPPSGADGALEGTIDVRPYRAKAAFGNVRKDNGGLDVWVVERDVAAGDGCDFGKINGSMKDTERMVILQMSKIAAPGSTLRAATARERADLTSHGGDDSKNMRVELSVQRGLGSTATAAIGTVTVKDLGSAGGTFAIDVATPNEPNGVSGSIKGIIHFQMCPSS